MNPTLYIGYFFLVAAILLLLIMLISSTKGVSFHDINFIGFTSSFETYICITFSIAFIFLSFGFHKKDKLETQEIMEQIKKEEMELKKD